MVTEKFEIFFEFRELKISSRSRQTSKTIVARNEGWRHLLVLDNYGTNPIEYSHARFCLTWNASQSLQWL